MSVTPKRQVSSRCSIISSKKWFTSLDNKFAYTYLERTMSNRLKKDELVFELKKRNLEVVVLSKEINFKSSGDKQLSYIIITSFEPFLRLFVSITPKATKITFPDNILMQLIED